MQTTTTVYDLGYIIGYNWPLIALVIAMYIFRTELRTLFNKAITAVTQIGEFEFQKYVAYRSLVDEESEGSNSVTQDPVLPEMPAARNWDSYENPTFVRKGQILSF